MELKKFSERLKELRLDKGLTQQQLAKQVDISKSMISSYELCEYEPTLSKAMSLAKFFDVSLDYLSGLIDFE